MANILTYLNNILTAVYGKNVRQSIHDGIEAINTEVVSTTERQNDLEATFENLIINAGNSNAEVVAARHDNVTNENHATVGERLDSVSEHLEYNTQQINNYDFVEYLSKSSNINSKMSVKIDVGNLKQFSVHAKTSEVDGIAYYFRKDANDDYITLMEGIYGDVVNTNSIIDSQNYSSKVGTGFNETYLPNGYTSNIGDYIYREFTNTKVCFNTYKNNQGGLWRAILDEGTTGEQQIDVSVYSASVVSLVSIPLFQNLENKKHTLKMIFQGQDPSNPTASPRGWYYIGGQRPQDTYRTFDIYNDVFYINKTDDLMYHYSNKEFALSCKPYGTVVNHQFIPQHDGIGTAFNLQDTKLLVDGKEVLWNTNNYYTDVECVQLIQKIKGIHTSDVNNPLLEIITVHTIKNGICNVSGKVKFLRKTEIDVGYVGMLPYFCSFAKKIKTSLDNTYSVITNNPNYKEYWTESDKAYSVAIINDVDSGNKENLAIAMTIDNPYKTFRNSLSGRGNPFSWIEHRSETLGKVYFQQFSNATIEADTVYRFDIRYLVCKLDKVNQYLL